MELLLIGFMKFETVAKWFGISYSYFKHKTVKEKKLKELTLYCDYSIARGGVEITKIYVDTYPYIGVNAKRVPLIPEKLTNWKSNEINTYSYIADSIIEETDTRPTVPRLNRKQEIMTMEETIRKDIHSFAQIVSKASVDDYGKASDGINGGGKKGWCEFIECRARRGENVCYDFVPLDEEDLKYLEQCWDNRMKAKKTKQTLKNVSERLKTDDELTKEQVYSMMQDWENSTYGVYIYRPMRDYLTNKYNDGEEWVYSQATLRHDWEEESVF